MENKDPAKDPHSGSNWRAIDIFVFSNGQQYSPPRKYHLQAEDIDLWKSTLAFLARTQYGPYHSTIDLFTIKGRKVTNPMELCNGESYVAVQPPDCFIHAGYDKYLLKASRSWEKRQARKFENTVESESNADIPDTMIITGTAITEDSNIESEQASAVLKRVSSNVTSQDASAILKPQPTATHRPNSLVVAKPTERRKSSLQAPFFVRKLTPTLLPTPSLRNPFKRNDSIKSANNVKLTKPEVARNSSASSGNALASPYKASTKGKTMRATSKSKDSPKRSSIVLPRLTEIVNEIVTSPSIKLAPTTNEKVIKSKMEPISTIESKNLPVIPSLEVYENPRKEMASISLNPYPKHSIIYDPLRQNAATTVLAQYSNINDDPNMANYVPEKQEKSIENDMQESIKIKHDLVLTNPDENETIEQMETEQNVNNLSTKTKQKTDEVNFPRVQEIDDTKNAAYGRTSIDSIAKNITSLSKQYGTKLPPIDKFNIDSVSEGIKRTMSKLLEPNVPFGGKANIQDMTPRKRSVTIEQPEKNQEAFNIIDKLDNNNDKALINPGKSNETIKTYNSSQHKTSITSDTIIENQSITEQIKETKHLSPQVADKLISDQYKTTLKKGDVVNLKLNIQIETHNGESKRHEECLKSQSVTFIQTEKEQTIIDDQLIVHNKSLLSLIGRELKNKDTGDNPKIVFVQCGTCKYCNDNTLCLDKDALKSYIILLPIEKLDMTPEICRCHCGDGKPDIEDLRIKSVIKPSGSCISLGKVSKNTTEADDTASRSIYFADAKSNENVVALVRKKSVAINEELITNNSRDPSSITQVIDVKSELIEISVKSSSGILSRSQKIDASTQTDWCDTLLEAKLLSDGLYTFHLPSLELLKNYKLT